jgi:hypothetical protein
MVVAKSLLGKGDLENWVSCVTRQIPGGCLAIQVLGPEGDVLLADEAFRRLLPGVADVRQG